MLKSFIVGALAVAALFDVVNAKANACNISKNTPNTTVANKFLKLHNQYRSEASKSMGNLVWNDELAQLAQNWSNYLAANKKFEHGNMINCSGGRVGQNLYYEAYSNKASLSDPSVAVTSWNNEKSFYNYTSTTCKPKAVCAHYTQIVWKATTQVGCGVSYFMLNSMFAFVVACDYYPPGNEGGKKPY